MVKTTNLEISVPPDEPASKNKAVIDWSSPWWNLLSRSILGEFALASLWVLGKHSSELCEEVWNSFSLPVKRTRYLRHCYINRHFTFFGIFSQQKLWSHCKTSCSIMFYSGNISCNWLHSFNVTWHGNEQFNWPMTQTTVSN